MIAIPNMEKPERCRDCRLHSYDWGDEYIPSHDVCHALSIYFNEGYEERHIKIDEEVHPDCPLIDIVTCGDCKYWHDHEWSSTCDKHIGNGFPSDYFCKDGERREDGNIHT